MSEALEMLDHHFADLERRLDVQDCRSFLIRRQLGEQLHALISLPEAIVRHRVDCLWTTHNGGASIAKTKRPVGDTDGAEALMTRQHTQELLSRAHLFASAAKAGYNVSFREFDYGVDYTVHSVGVDPLTGKRKEDGIKFDLQLKSTVDWRVTGETVVYNLDAGTLNAMIDRHRVDPMFLALLCLPEDEGAWLTSTEEDTTLRHCCYWYDARKDERTPNLTTRAIDIPRQNLLTPDSLKMLMELARLARSRRRRK